MEFSSGFDCNKNVFIWGRSTIGQFLINVSDNKIIKKIAFLDSFLAPIFIIFSKTDFSYDFFNRMQKIEIFEKIKMGTEMKTRKVNFQIAKVVLEKVRNF